MKDLISKSANTRRPAPTVRFAEQAVGLTKKQREFRKLAINKFMKRVSAS